jgi:AcrR family transcriptional regulator
MPKTVKPPRAYSSERRAEQARETRMRMLGAAKKLFLEEGYGATTIAAIAREAGVAVQTVYAVFGSKRQLLSDLVDVSIVGDDLPIPMRDRPIVRETEAEPDCHKKIERMGVHLTETLRRTAEITVILRGAAGVDADAAAVFQKGVRERLRGMTEFAAHLARSGCLRNDLDPAHAADVLSLHMDPASFHWFVHERGWTDEQYARWYIDTVSAAILKPRPKGARKR